MDRDRSLCHMVGNTHHSPHETSLLNIEKELDCSTTGQLLIHFNFVYKASFLLICGGGGGRRGVLSVQVIKKKKKKKQTFQPNQ